MDLKALKKGMLIAAQPTVFQVNMSALHVATSHFYHNSY